MESCTQSQVVLNMAAQVFSQLLVSNAFSATYPLDSVKPAPNGVTYRACDGDPEVPALVHTSVWALVAHARAVMATGATTIEGLLDVERPKNVHQLVAETLSAQVSWRKGQTVCAFGGSVKRM